MSSLPKIKATLSVDLPASVSGFLQETKVLPIHRQAIKVSDKE
jgi:hypothetical protein